MIERLWAALSSASYQHTQQRRSPKTMKWKGYSFAYISVEMAEDNDRFDIDRITLHLPDQTVVIAGLFSRDGGTHRFEWDVRPTDENFIMLQLLLS